MQRGTLFARSGGIGLKETQQLYHRAAGITQHLGPQAHAGHFHGPVHIRPFDHPVILIILEPQRLTIEPFGCFEIADANTAMGQSDHRYLSLLLSCLIGGLGQVAQFLLAQIA